VDNRFRFPCNLQRLARLPILRAGSIKASH
jgi:hypothetical protein